MEWDILDLIERDHEELARQIEEIMTTKRTPSEATLDPKFSMMQHFFLAHLNAEEAVLYPLLERRDEQLMAAAYTEHEAIRDGMQDLSGRWFDEARWDGGLRDLQRFVLDHFTREEGSIFDAARAAFSGGELQTLGDEYDERMRESARRRVGPGRAETAG